MAANEDIFDELHEEDDRKATVRKEAEVKPQETPKNDGLEDNPSSDDNKIVSSKNGSAEENQRKPRQPFPLYLSPLDTSQSFVVLGYCLVFVAAIGTRLHKLGEPDHIWYVGRSFRRPVTIAWL